MAKVNEWYRIAATRPTINKWMWTTNGGRSEMQRERQENIALMLFGFSCFSFLCAQIANITENTAAHSLCETTSTDDAMQSAVSHEPVETTQQLYRRFRTKHSSRYHNNTTAASARNNFVNMKSALSTGGSFLTEIEREWARTSERERERFFFCTFYFLFLSKTFKLTLTAPNVFCKACSDVSVCECARPVPPWCISLSLPWTVGMFILHG